jgi:rhodanese-related sulfurtransferase
MEKYFKPRVILSVVIVSLALIIAAIPKNTTQPNKLSADKLLEEIQAGKQFITTDAVAEMIVNKDPSLQLIDVRSKKEFDKYSLPGAINIPLSSLLSTEFEDIFNQGAKMNVFYSNGTLQADEAWMITRQLGYVNNYVLQGGLNYWVETILNPSVPPATSPDDEFVKYDLRKGASMVVGGSSAVQMPSAKVVPTPVAKPALMKKTKKKGASGGCS